MDLSNLLIALFAGATAAATCATYVVYSKMSLDNREIHRADVLFETVKFFDPKLNRFTEEIHQHTSLVMVQRNYGKTTATCVRIQWQFFVDGDPIPDTPILPPAIIGPDGELETRIVADVGTLTGARFNDVGHGSAILRAIGHLTYSDVFGDEHRARFAGSFRTMADGTGGFAVEIEERT
jgi:hypothetical protein